ncbi:type II secretion system protein GspG [Pelotomaculum propionicicum]|uniref:type II secretion system protein GspG n=1 Tax=Pelotomaculum propionicicum TaxID=258475 RepID=UPI003B7CA03D
MLRRLIRNEKGFTMVEMMVVMIIIAVLIAGGVKFYLGYIENSKVTKAKAQISTMQAALDTYYAENGAYPSDTTLDALKAKMLNAGLIVTATPGSGTAGQDGTLNVADPWGASSFYIYKSTDGSKFYIRSGRDTVQNQPATTAVFGSGSAGTSNAPVVGAPSEP